MIDSFKSLASWLLLFAAPAVFLAGCAADVAPRLEDSQKPRLMVLLDLGQDPDDQQSLVRLLHHANDFQIEGLILCADHNYKHELPTIRMDLAQETLRRYGLVHPNLLKHDPSFPSREELLAVTKSGNNLGGNEIAVEDTIGEGKDTEGSDWIIKMADKDDPRPLDVAVWGGAADLAQALWKVRETRTAEELQAFVKKLRVFTIGDQDSTNFWIMEEFPDLFYVRSRGEERFHSSYHGMYLGGDYDMLSRNWILGNIVNSSDLGAFYPAKAGTNVNPHHALKEGDTPSFFYFLNNGLQDPGKPEYGGWGGRYKLRDAHYYQDSADTVGDTTSYRATVWRWRTHHQNEFAARAEWTHLPYRKANHHPRAVLNGDATMEILYSTVAPGETVKLSAEGSTDPDRDALSYNWWIYPEAGSISSIPEITGADQAQASFTMPEGRPGETLHVILEVSDNGRHPLVSYRRLVVQVGQR